MTAHDCTVVVLVGVILVHQVVIAWLVDRLDQARMRHTLTVEGHEILILGSFVLWPEEVQLDDRLRRRCTEAVRQWRERGRTGDKGE